MTSRPDGSFQQPPTRPPIPPVPTQGSGPPEGTGRRGVAIVVLVIGALIIIGMLTEELDGTEETQGTGDMVTVVSEDSELQLQVPASWEDSKEDLNDTLESVADILMAGPSGDTWVAVASDAKEDFVEVPSLEESAELYLDVLTEDESVTDVSEGVSVSEYDPPGIRHMVRVSIDNENQVLMYTFLETERRLIQIIAGTLASEWEADRDLLESISNSLQERPAETD